MDCLRACIDRHAGCRTVQLDAAAGAVARHRAIGQRRYEYCCGGCEFVGKLTFREQLDLGEPGRIPEPSATASSVSGTFTGQAVQTREGTVQVQVTIAGGVITEITALQLPSGSAKHDQINATAEPILRSEALAAQSANIDIVSGATYTSEGYIQSLQSALDQAS